MASSAPLTEDELRRFIDEWYEKLDVHAPVEEVLPLLADDGLEMVFPEVTERGHEGFKRWYEKVTNRFFDEIHTLNKIDITTQGERATIKLDLNWQCKIWDPPAAKSQWLGFDAGQTWEMQRSAQTGKPVILRYVVETFVPMPGSRGL
jgi:hypothetical protein